MNGLPQNNVTAEQTVAPASHVLLYQIEDGETQVECHFVDENIWLTINQIADFHGHNKSAVSLHLSKIYEEHELTKKATVAEYATVQAERAREVERKLDYYNLDAQPSVVDQDLKAALKKLPKP